MKLSKKIKLLLKPKYFAFFGTVVVPTIFVSCVVPNANGTSQEGSNKDQESSSSNSDTNKEAVSNNSSSSANPNTSTPNNTNTPNKEANPDNTNNNGSSSGGDSNNDSSSGGSGIIIDDSTDPTPSNPDNNDNNGETTQPNPSPTPETRPNNPSPTSPTRPSSPSTRPSSPSTRPSNPRPTPQPQPKPTPPAKKQKVLKTIPTNNNTSLLTDTEATNRKSYSTDGQLDTNNNKKPNVSNSQLFIDLSQTPSNTSNWKVLFKPENNDDKNNIIMDAQVQNNKLVINDIEELTFLYKNWYITEIFNSSSSKKMEVPELYGFGKTENYDLDIESITFSKKSDSYNTWNGNIKIDFDEDYKYKNKYFRLVFIDSNVSSSNEYYFNGLNALSYDKRPYTSMTEYLKHVYLTKEELGNFTFNNLTESFGWKLLKIDLVNRVDNAIVKEFKNLDSKVKGTQTLKEEVKANTESYTSGFDSNFKTSSLNSNNGTNITLEQLKTTTESIDLNYNNYKNVNKYYLTETQKLIHTKETANKKPKDISFNNSKSYNWGVLFESDDDKRFTVNEQKDTYTLTKDLSKLEHLSENNEAIINFNFFANPHSVDIVNWYMPQISYNISFSYNKLKEETNKTLDNLEIEFLGNSKDILIDDINWTGEPAGTWNGPSKTKYLKDDFLKKVINTRLKAKVSLSNDNKLTIELKAKDNSIISSDIYYHNLSQKLSTFVESAQNYLSIMSLNENSSDAINYSGKDQKQTTDIKVKGYLFDKTGNWESKTSVTFVSGKGNEFKITDPMERILEVEKPDIMKNITERSFANSKGTLWLLDKVNNNDNDNTYYIGTNKHVPIQESDYVRINKKQDSESDVEAIYDSHTWNFKTKKIWSATDNLMLDGGGLDVGDNDDKRKKRAGADFQVAIVDITEMINFYNSNKDDSTVKTTNKFKIAEFFNNWKTITQTPNSISKKSKHIKNNQISNFYIAGFPAQSGDFQDRKNVRFRMSFAKVTDRGEVATTDNDLVIDAQSDNLSFYHLISGEWDNNKNGSKNILSGGASGSAVFDNEGNFSGVFQGTDLGLYSVALLAGPRIDFFGSYNEFNTKSLASWIERMARLYPEKYKKSQVFKEFANPVYDTKFKAKEKQN